MTAREDTKLSLQVVSLFIVILLSVASGAVAWGKLSACQVSQEKSLENKVDKAVMEIWMKSIDKRLSNIEAAVVNPRKEKDEQ